MSRVLRSFGSINSADNMQVQQDKRDSKTQPGSSSNNNNNHNSNNNIDILNKLSFTIKAGYFRH